MSLIRKHVAVLQAWACLDLVVEVIVWISFEFSYQTENYIMLIKTVL